MSPFSPREIPVLPCDWDVSDIYWNLDSLDLTELLQGREYVSAYVPVTGWNGHNNEVWHDGLQRLHEKFVDAIIGVKRRPLTVFLWAKMISTPCLNPLNWNDSSSRLFHLGFLMTYEKEAKG